MEICLFCMQPEPTKYLPRKGNEYICSGCVITLNSTPQEEIEKAYLKALNNKSLDQAKALKIFLTNQEGELNDTERPDHRTRTVEIARNQETRPARFAD